MRNSAIYVAHNMILIGSSYDINHSLGKLVSPVSGVLSITSVGDSLGRGGLALY